MSQSPSPKQSSSGSSAASFIKVIQNLIQSDQQQVLLQKMKILGESFPILKKLNSSLSNSQKLILFMRDNQFKQKLNQKLLEKFGIQKLPTIRIQVYSVRYNVGVQQELQELDLAKVFQKFGKVVFSHVDGLIAYVQFQTLISSYCLIKTLNQFQIIRDSLRLSVRWCTSNQQNIVQQLFYAKFNSITSAFGPPINQKYSCKYNIYLACPPEFKLAQKIIGPKGNNIKKIFQQISSKKKASGVTQIQKSLKMRLRGKNSGYRQGPNSEQSNQILNFCISSKQRQLYELGCSQFEKIMQKLSLDYKTQYQIRYKCSAQSLVYKKYILTNNTFIQQKQYNLSQSICKFSPTQTQCPSILQKQIQQQINKRNKARRLGKYREADQIRDRLKDKGVLIVDGTGKKGAYTTTWRYRQG